MVDAEPDNIVLRYLRQIDGKLDRLIADVRELKGRVTRVDANIALLYSDNATTSARIDRIEDRLGLIERRLELREGT